jgi:hypothetical protein
MNNLIKIEKINCIKLKFEFLFSIKMYKKKLEHHENILKIEHYIPNKSDTSDTCIIKLESYNDILKNDHLNISFYPHYYKINDSFLLKYLHYRHDYMLVHIDIKLIELLELAKLQYIDQYNRNYIIFACMLAYFNEKKYFELTNFETVTPSTAYGHNSVDGHPTLPRETLLIMRMHKFYEIFQLLKDLNISISIIKIYNYKKFVKYEYRIYLPCILSYFSKNNIYIYGININHNIPDEIINNKIKFKPNTTKISNNDAYYFTIACKYIYNNNNENIYFYLSMIHI